MGQNNSDLQFRATVAGFSKTNAGFLFDNVSYSSSSGPGPAGCDVPIEKHADSSTVTAGGLVGYRIAARNRGRLTERNLLVCDRIPRETTFVRANRRLRRIGGQRCLFVPSLRPGRSAGFHLTLRVSANAHAGTLDNTCDDMPGQPPGQPATPPAVSPDQPPGTVPGPPPQAKPIAKAKAIVKVLAKPTRHRHHPPPPPPPPRVTG